MLWDGFQNSSHQVCILFTEEQEKRQRESILTNWLCPSPQKGALLDVFPNYSAEEQTSPKLSSLKQQILSHNFYGQESGYSLARISCLRVSYKAVIKSLTRTAVISRFKWGRSASKFTDMVVGRIQFLQALGLRVSVLLWLLTEDLSWFLAMRASSRAVHNMATGFNQSEQVRDQKKVNKMQASVPLVPNPGGDIPSLLYFFMRSKPLGPAHTHRHEYQEEGSLGGKLELPTTLTNG